MSEQINNPNWTPHIMKKNKTNIKTNNKSGYIQSHELKVEKQINNDEYIKPKINIDQRQQIINARLSKKWTQKEFAQKCNLPLQIVQQYEQGKGIPLQQHITKMNRILGIVVKLN